MKRVTIIAIVLVIGLATWASLALGGGGEGPRPPETPETPPASATPAGTGVNNSRALDVVPELNSLDLAGGEVQMTYPPDLALAVTPEQLQVRSMIPACSEPFDYCLYLPAEEFGGTNLSSAGLRVSRRGDLTAELSCLLAQPAGWSDLQPGLVRTATASTARFGDVGEGAAGSYSQGELYRLWTGESCYEFESRQVMTRFENYEPGAVAEFSAEDQRQLEARFLAVLQSVSLVGGETIEWPLARTSDLGAFVMVEAPAPGQDVTSPLTVSGQAVGPWFFEGSFPLEIVTLDGELVATGYVTADGEWMTTDFVGFGGAIEFEVAQATAAYLVLRRANPSDLPENDAAVRVAVTLLP